MIEINQSCWLHDLSAEKKNKKTSNLVEISLKIIKNEIKSYDGSFNQYF